MRSQPRKSAPKVRDGKVQRKNRTALTPHYSITPQNRPVIDRRPPGAGYRHLITVKQLNEFIDLLPDWKKLSIGLNALVLAPGSLRAMGWHRQSIVALCAWERAIEREWDTDFVESHRRILDLLGVPCEAVLDDKGDALDYRICRFTEASARGFQLMHVLLHELGHHHDRMTTRSKRWPSRGESYAEEYANKYAEQIFDRYVKTFGW